LKINLVIAISGASGSPYSRLLLEKLTTLSSQYKKIAVIFSENGRNIWKTENSDFSISQIPFPIFENNDFSATFASGSSDFNKMIICPASMGTVGKIASGISNDLISRTADVMLKEKRTLILVPRETPLNLIHLQNLTHLAQAGAIICPAMPSFYSLPQNINALLETVVDRILELAGFKIQTFRYNFGRKN